MKIIQTIGGLGSQMCAYATYLTLVDNYKNESVYYDTHYFDEKIDTGHNGEELKRVFGLKWNEMPKTLNNLLYSKKFFFKLARKITKILRLQKYYFDTSYCFNSEVFDLRGNYIIFQAWTSLKYFESIKNRLAEIFKFPDFSSDDKKNLEVKKMIEESDSVAVHIRRGDYVDDPILGGLVPLGYYERAVNIVKEKVGNPRFFIFSDDSKWTKENLRLDGCVYIDWNKDVDSYKDMQLMALCKHNIIPNSSFSWWGALLNKNPNKIVINPKIWSKQPGLLLDMPIQDENWMALDNQG